MYFRFFIEASYWLVGVVKVERGRTFSKRELERGTFALPRILRIWVYQPTRNVSRKVWTRRLDLTEESCPRRELQRSTSNHGFAQKVRSLVSGAGSRQNQNWER